MGSIGPPGGIVRNFATVNVLSSLQTRSSDPGAPALNAVGAPDAASPSNRIVEQTDQFSALLAELQAVMEQAGVSPELCAQLNSHAVAQEKRLQRLESTVGTLRVERELMREKLEKVEKLAKKKGMFTQTLMDYGLPFVLWWGGLWLGMFFSLFMLLQCEVVSWQDSLRPWMEHFGFSV